MKRTIIIILLVGVLGGAFYAYSLYNKEHINVAETETVAEFTASDLFAAFDENEEENMTKYADQVIGVKGIIYSIDLSNDAEPQVVLNGNDDNGYIRCGFKPEELEKVKALKEGNELKLKGECKGINKAEGLDLLADVDVVLSKCIIIE